MLAVVATIIKMKNSKIKKEKIVSFNQIFKAKKAYEKASELKDKTYKEYMNILTKSEHLNKKIATVGNRSWYVTIDIDSSNYCRRDPKIYFSPIEK
jgi:hypothetical protein